jgi:autotransporter-associated beta strand protein
MTIPRSCLLLLVLPLALAAQTTVTWTGGGADTNWNNGANWSSGSVPDSFVGTIAISGPGIRVEIPSGTAVNQQWFSVAYTNVSNGATLAVAGSVRSNSYDSSYNFTDATLELMAGGYTQFGQFNFYGTAQLTAAGAGAISHGSNLHFYDSSGLGTMATGAVAAGNLVFHGTREITFTPGVFAGGYATLTDDTYTTIAQANTFVGAGDANNPSVFLKLEGQASATVTAAGALATGAELNAAGDSQSYLNVTGALVDSSLSLEGNATVTLGADQALTNSNLSFASWLGDTTGGTLELNGHALTVNSLRSPSGPSDPGHEGTIKNSAAGAVTFTINTTDSVEFKGTITNSGGGAISLVKTGAGTQTLGAPGSTLDYTGPTTVSAGSLYLNGSLTASTVTVQSGATFGGMGSVGTVTFNASSTFDVGDSAEETGNFTAQTMTLASGTTMLLDLSDATGGAGLGWDHLDVTGTLTLGAVSLVLNTGRWYYDAGQNDWVFSAAPANFDTTQNYSFAFATAGSIIGFNPALFTITGGDDPGAFTGTWAVAQSGNQLLLNYTGGSAIPEPSTYAAFAGLACLAVAIGRRRGALGLTF